MGFDTVGGVYRKLTCSPWRRSFQHVDAQTSHLVKEVFTCVYLYLYRYLYLYIEVFVFAKVHKQVNRFANVELVDLHILSISPGKTYIQLLH